tara:strand:+ start:99 stop:650 length:552 start_codon:yes stop_codon:yes gene_type:complete
VSSVCRGSSSLWEGKTAAMERGDHIHLCWNRFLETGHPGNSSPYSEWVSILIDDPLWKQLTPIALEHELVDRKFWIAGKLDGLFYNNETEEVILIDLKTFEEKFDEAKGKWSKPSSSHSKQLGGYIDLLYINHPEISIDKAMIVYSTQRQVIYKTIPDIERCRGDYQLARRAYFDKQRELHAF